MMYIVLVYIRRLLGVSGKESLEIRRIERGPLEFSPPTPARPAQASPGQPTAPQTVENAQIYMQWGSHPAGATSYVNLRTLEFSRVIFCANLHTMGSPRAAR